MPTKVIVNPNLITINDGSSFLVTASDGSIDDNQAQGFFVGDTRLISYYEISFNRYQLLLLARFFYSFAPFWDSKPMHHSES